MRKRRLGSGELSLAAVISLTLWSAQASAQEANNRQTVEEIIVTGSLIEGTPEDSALPVEVITLEELDNLGRPSAIDLVKTMSEVGQVAGEADRSNTFPIGAATVNLRNLGSRYTTVVFNGRRFPEQFGVTVGRFNNISWIPSAAIGRVETLKQGGAVTYGADAIGGVVNYITRKEYDGLELNAEYRYIEDSDGDYNADVLWGNTFDKGNVMVVAGFQRRNTLMASDREFTQRQFLENTNPYSAAGQPGSYQFQATTVGGVAAPVINAAPTATGNNLYSGARHISSTGLMRDPYCTELGGHAGWSATPSPVCYFNESNYEKLVEQSNTYQFYNEFNYALTDSLNLHTELTYYQMDQPDIALSPSASQGSFPLVSQTPNAARQSASAVLGFFVPGYHPGVAPLIDALNAASPAGGPQTFTAAQRAAILASGRVTLPQAAWRPFGAGGAPGGGLYDVQHNNTKMYRFTAELKGDVPEFWGTNLTWTVAGTYSQVDYLVELQDMVVDRFQAALNGFGGPNCTGSTPGANGCQFFNPFSSAIPRNIYTGESNPGFIPQLANDPTLIDWLYTPISLDREYRLVIGDLLLSGDTGINLPGGPIAMAIGAQFRRTDEEFTLDELSNRDINPCPTIGVTNCATTSRTGPLAMTRNVTILGTTQNTDRYYPVAAAFFELQLPVLDSVNVQLAGRYEKFYSDITDVDNDIFVPAGAIKWQPLDWLGLRLSLGKTFSQVNPPEDNGATINQSAANNDFGGFGGDGSRYTTNSYDNLNLKSEESEYYNVGFIIQRGAFSTSVDYFHNELQEGTRTLTADAILRALVVGAPAAGAQINCSSPLLNVDPDLRDAQGNTHAVVELNGPCVQGQSLLNSPLGGGGLTGGALHYFGDLGETNGGTLEQSGIDFNISYSFDFLGGTLRPSLDLTYYLTYEYQDFELFGVTVAQGYDGIGFTNTGPGRLLQAVPEYRGSIGVNFNRGAHTLNLLARYLPRIVNDDIDDFDALRNNNANIGDAAGFTTGPGGACPGADPTLTSDLGNVPAGNGTGQFGAPGNNIVPPNSGATITNGRGFCNGQNVALQSFKELKESYNLDLTYRVELPQEIDLSFSIYNLTNEEPEFSRSQLSYSAFFGSPLERNFELGFRKRF